MPHPLIDHWLEQCAERRLPILKYLWIPATASQLARWTGLPVDTCRYTLNEFRTGRLVSCVNPEASRYRLFRLTRTGYQVRKRGFGDAAPQHVLAAAPLEFWKLYGQVLYPHRAAVMKTLTSLMPAQEIRRRARRADPKLRMNSGNTRSVLAFLVKNGIVAKLRTRGSAYPSYQHLPLGDHLRLALIESEVRRT